MGTSVSLEFEKPIVELEKQIDELKRLAGGQQLDVEEEIAPLQKKLASLREEIYKNLSPWQRVLVARSTKRPFTLDYIQLAFTDFIELHGDRAYREDAAIAEGDERWQFLSEFGLPYAGGKLGRIPAQFIYWRHRFAASLLYLLHALAFFVAGLAVGWRQHRSRRRRSRLGSRASGSCASFCRGRISMRRWSM